MEQEELAQPTLRETLVENVAAAREEPAQVDATPAPDARARDEQGRFVAKDSAPEVPDEGAGKDTAPVAASPATPVPPAAEPPKPPSSWKKELWPVWEALHKGQITPDQAKALVEYIPQRETQFATGVSTYKQIADSAKPLLDAIAPFQADLDQHGLKAADMVGKLMHAHKTLALGSPQEKLALFGKLAQDYGIPLQAYFDQNAQQQYLATPYTPAPQPQPNVQEIVRQELAVRETNQAIEAMEKDTENYPFFQYVRPTMAQLLETNEATDLNDAYLKALDRPEHAMLVSIQQKQQEEADAKRKAEAAQAAARVARSNAVSPKSATPVVAPVNEKKGVRDALRDAIAQHAGGARV